MEQRYGTDPSRRYGTGVWNGGMERGYGTGVWNGCGPGACSGPPILTCTHMFTSFYMDFSCLGADQLDLYQADTCINDLTVKHIPW